MKSVVLTIYLIFLTTKHIDSDKMFLSTNVGFYTKDPIISNPFTSYTNDFVLLGLQPSLDQTRIFAVKGSSIVSVLTTGGTLTTHITGSTLSCTSSVAGDTLVLSRDGVYLFYLPFKCYKIFRIKVSDYTWSVYSGTGSQGIFDGAAGTAQIHSPKGSAMNPEGTYLYFGDANCLRRMLVSDGSISTFMGTTSTTVASGTCVAAAGGSARVGQVRSIVFADSSTIYTSNGCWDGSSSIDSVGKIVVSSATFSLVNEYGGNGINTMFMTRDSTYLILPSSWAGITRVQYHRISDGYQEHYGDSLNTQNLAGATQIITCEQTACTAVGTYRATCTWYTQGSCIACTNKPTNFANYYYGAGTYNGNNCPYTLCSSSCSNGQYRTACTTTADGTCIACTNGPANSQYTGSAYISNNCPWQCLSGYYLSGSSCPACSSCSANTYISSACTITSNTVCTGCTLTATACNNNNPTGYYRAACTGSADGVCTLCSNKPSNSYYTGASPTYNSNACPWACNSGFYVSGSSCVACTTCNAGQYQTTACTSTANRQCQTCAANTVSTTSNAVSCDTCVAGKVPNAQRSACDNCPTGTRSGEVC